MMIEKKNMYKGLASWYTLIVSGLNFFILLLSITRIERISLPNLLILAGIIIYVIFKFAINLNLVIDKGNAALLVILNILTLILEIPHVFYNGFYYKLTNGSELIFFTTKNSETGVFNFGLDFIYLNMEFLLKFRSQGEILIGLNLISLILIGIYYKAYYQLKSTNHIKS
jgi:hypothetical protein